MASPLLALTRNYPSPNPPPHQRLPYVLPLASNATVSHLSHVFFFSRSLFSLSYISHMIPLYLVILFVSALIAGSAVLSEPPWILPLSLPSYFINIPLSRSPRRPYHRRRPYRRRRCSRCSDRRPQACARNCEPREVRGFGTGSGERTKAPFMASIVMKYTHNSDTLKAYHSAVGWLKRLLEGPKKAPRRLGKGSVVYCGLTNNSLNHARGARAAARGG